MPYRPHRHTEKREFPAVPPVEHVLDELHKLEAFMRDANERARLHEHNRREAPPTVVARRALIEQRIREQIAADTRPLSERVPEYVLRYDDTGNVVGLTRR